MLVLEDVTWAEYERLLDDLKDWPGKRVTYDHGRLEIMSPSRRHEQYKEFITSVIRILAEELRMDMQSSGSATWRRKKSLRGVEADACFHIANAGSVIGKDELDLNSDPPPDLVVEIDMLHESQNKFPTYAILGVPEIWRYAAKDPRDVYERRAAYVEVKASRSFDPDKRCSYEVHREKQDGSRDGRPRQTRYQWVRSDIG
jgi:Uma2 family endonuclease